VGVDLPDHDLSDHDLFAEREPHEVFDRLRAAAPVAWNPEPNGRAGFWAVTRYRDVLAVLRDTQTFSNAAGGISLEEPAADELEARRNFLELDPPEHGRFRKELGPHFTPKAKSVIWLFMNGGVSHMETFDPKPMLTKYAGKSINETPYQDAQNPEKLKLARGFLILFNPLPTGFVDGLHPLQPACDGRGYARGAYARRISRQSQHLRRQGRQTRTELGFEVA